MDADTLFRRFFLPLYPEGARSDLATLRTVDANSAKNPAIYAHLGDAASRFAVLFPKLVGEGSAALGELDFTDASVHRLSAAITARLARGDDVATAVAGGCGFIRAAIAGAPGLGGGTGPVDHFAPTGLPSA